MSTHSVAALAPPSPSITLTATRRLARALRARFDRAQLKDEALSWRTSAAFQVDEWLRALWRSSWADELVLNDTQAAWLWEEAVRESPLAAGAGVDVAVTLARDAERLLADWNLGRAEPPASTDETRAFNAWRRHVGARLTAERWLDLGRMRERVLPLIERRAVPLPEAVCFAGFDVRRPYLEALARSLRAARVKVTYDEKPFTTEGRPATPARDLSFAAVARPASRAAELSFAARWCRKILTDAPHATIGVVVPDLASRAAALRAAFEEELVPAAFREHDPARLHPLPFNVSYAPPIAEQPIVAIALDILRAADGALTADVTSRLLRSPFIGDAERERSARARADLALREARCRQYDLPWLVAVLRRLVAGEDPLGTSAGDPRDAVSRTKIPVSGLATLFTGWADLVASEGSEPRSARDWVRYYDKLLRTIGWPGERVLSSYEIQAVDRFQKLLRELGTLDLVRGPLSHEDAWARLRRSADSRSFQPAGGDHAPIQVLGVLEASGFTFDYLLLAGFTDEAWPLRPSPSPLLDMAWQRAQGMPSTSNVEELAIARQWTARLLAAAPEVVASVPREAEDRELFMSPLFAAVRAKISADLPATAQRVRLHAAWRRDLLECVPAVEAPAIQFPDIPETSEPGVRHAAQRGGAGVFADQASCPFRAFAHYRLRARGPVDLADGTHPFDRGNFFHVVLHMLWSEWGSSARFQERSSDERSADVERALVAAREIFLDPRRDLSRVHRRIEMERARGLINAWLAIEAARAPFTIDALELKQFVRAGDLEVEVRVDRIDRLADDGVVILDYKTGAQQDLKKWEGERPREPQLPLYAVKRAENDDVVALAFVALNTRAKESVTGLAAAGGILPGVHGYTGDWGARLSEWRRVLDQLAGQFCGGYAAIDPLEPSVCDHCDLHALCRIDERAPGSEGDGDGRDGNGGGGRSLPEEGT